MGLGEVVGILFVVVSMILLSFEWLSRVDGTDREVDQSESLETLRRRSTR